MNQWEEEIAKLKNQIFELQQDIKSKDRVYQSQKRSKEDNIHHLQLLRNKNKQLIQSNQRYQKALKNNNTIIEQLRTQKSNLQKELLISKTFVQNIKQTKEDVNPRNNIQVLELENKVAFLQKELKFEKQDRKREQKQNKTLIDQLEIKNAQLQKEKLKGEEKCKSLGQEIYKLINNSKITNNREQSDQSHNDSNSSFDFPSSISQNSQQHGQSMQLMKKNNNLIILEAQPFNNSESNHIKQNSQDQKKVNILENHLNELKKQNLTLNKLCRQFQQEISLLRMKQRQKQLQQTQQENEQKNELHKQRLLLFVNEQEKESQVRPKKVNKEIFKAMLSHFHSISHKQKIPYLYMISIWAEQMLDRIKNSLDDLSTE